MRKIWGFMLLLVVGMLLIPADARAYEENGFQYRVSSKKAYITGCTLKEEAITIPDTIAGFPVVGIAGYAFDRTSYTSVKIPESVKSIGAYAFYSAKKLKSIKLPSKIKMVSHGTFAKCDKLAEVTLSKSLTKIGTSSFMDCVSLKKIVMPDGVRSIPMNTNMQFIGNSAFRGTKLTSIHLGNKVTFIGNRVFADCRRLKKIAVPASVTGINPGAFNNCVSLREINVASGNRNYSSSAGVLYNKDKSKLIQYPLHKMSSSFTTPSSLSKIRSKAFEGNNYLRHVTIHSTTVGASAFSNMENLQSVTMTKTVSIEANAFRNNTKLTTVNLPDSVTKIGNNAFQYSHIGTIRIPSRLTNLSISAFYDCNNLSSFTGGSGAYRVEDGVLYNGSKTKLLKYPSKKATTVFEVPNTVREVNSYAFERVAKLTKLSFGTQFHTLRYKAISSVNRLKSIVFNANRLSYRSYNGVSDCDNLAVIVGPNSYVMRQMAENAYATLITL